MCLFFVGVQGRNTHVKRLELQGSTVSHFQTARTKNEMATTLLLKVDQQWLTLWCWRVARHGDLDWKVAQNLVNLSK